MAEYDLEFAQEMAEASDAILSKTQTASSARAAIYCSLVACEVALKAGLEAAGVPLKKIRAQNHDLTGLLGRYGSCRVSAEITAGAVRTVPASRINSIEIDAAYPDATIGKLIEEIQKNGTSKYPTGIRYGALFKHYPASVVSRLGKAVVNAVREHIDDIRSD